MLPVDNIPTQKHQAQRRISEDPAQNFGCFGCEEKSEDFGFEIKESVAHGVKNQALGKGVFTKV
jgi:hypothetical protein